MNDEIRIRARLDDFHNYVLLSIYKLEEPGHRLSVMKTDSFEEVGDTYISYVPHVAIDMKEAQALTDQLWQCGLRPTEGAGSAGAMAEAQAHIKDLQSITDRVLKIVENEKSRMALIANKREVE